MRLIPCAWLRATCTDLCPVNWRLGCSFMRRAGPGQGREESPVCRPWEFPFLSGERLIRIQIPGPHLQVVLPWAWSGPRTCIFNQPPAHSAVGHASILPLLGLKLLAKETGESIFAPVQIVESLCASFPQ